MSSRIIRQNSPFGFVLLGGHRSYVYHITVRHSVLQVTQRTHSIRYTHSRHERGELQRLQKGRKVKTNKHPPNDNKVKTRKKTSPLRKQK